MSGYQERLQGKVRLARIQRIRTASLLALAGATIFFIGAGFVAQGASLKPLFLPLAEALQLALIMGLIATILAMYFRNLEIKHAQGDSQRFLMAKDRMGRASWAAGAAIAIAVLLFLPVSVQLSGDLLTEPPALVSVPGFGDAWLNFTSPDPLGLSLVRHVVVTASNGAGNVRITVMYQGRTTASGWLNATGRLTFPLDANAASRYGAWSVFFQNSAGGSPDLAVALQKGVVPVLVGPVPFLLVLYGAANLGWWVGLRPIRERTRSAAVYAGGVSTEAEQDERFYAEYAANPVRDVIPMTAPEPAARPSSVVVRSRPTSPAPAAVPAAATVLLPPESPRPGPKPPKPRVETPESLTMKGDVLFEAKQYDSAIVAFDEALRLSPSHVPALWGRAECLLRLDKKADAIDACRRVLAADRKYDRAWRALASIFIGARRWREALEVVDEFLRQRPNDADFLELKGDVLTNLGRRAEALTAYNAATALDPNDENLKQKIEEVRVDVPGLLSRALIASASGNYAQALNLFDDILEVEPSNVNALIGKAVAYRRGGKSKEALNCLDLVLSIQPGNAAALLNKGHILESDGDLEGALETFDRLVSMSSLDDEAWAAEGDVLAKMGRDDDALRAYAEALKLNPGDDVIQAKVRELEEARSMQAEVLQELYKVKGIGPAKAKALLDAGYKTAEDFSRATVEQLMSVRGITRKIAEDLVKHFADRYEAK